MMFEVVNTGIVPSAGPVNGTVRAGPFLFMAHTPKDPVTGEMLAGDITVQTRRCLENLKMAVEAGGGTLADVVQTRVYLIELEDGPGMNAVYREFMPQPFANRATVVVKALLNPVMRIEIVSTAYLG